MMNLLGLLNCQSVFGHRVTKSNLKNGSLEQREHLAGFEYVYIYLFNMVKFKTELISDNK